MPARTHARKYRATETCALLVGINYVGTEAELRGCVADTYRLQQALVESGTCSQNDVRLLGDHSFGTTYPTRANMLKQIRAFVRKGRRTRGIRSVVLHFSGHGTQLWDDSQVGAGDDGGPAADQDIEHDLRDEALCPVDYAVAGMIRDDDLYKAVREALADDTDTAVFVLLDCCNSGSGADLPFRAELADDGAWAHHVDGVDELAGHVTMISGCADHQYSADAWFPGRQEFGGAMTNALLAVTDGCRELRTKPAKQIVAEMHAWLHGHGFEQRPQLSSSFVMDDAQTLLP